MSAHAPPSQFDLIIIGAGPTGLCLAHSLHSAGLRIALVETQPEAAIAEPAFDGREIALTRHSQQVLERLGLWQRIEAGERHPLRTARVLDGGAHSGMDIEPRAEGAQLGWLVPNDRIRRAAWEAVQGQAGLACYFGCKPIAMELGERSAEVQLSNGELLRGRLLVAADSRFSETRRAAGIAADMEDFGKTMLVCRMALERPHHGTAWEWFGHGQTLALLPLSEYQASAVLTLPAAEIQRLQGSDDATFGAEITRRFQQRLGAMRPVSSRHAYPLVGVYPRRFIGPRFALVGDAAVGMHPVTAHGFNFGLLGQELLSSRILRAKARGLDPGNPRDLIGYERELRRATRPLYLATRTIARLYTCDALPARLLRRAGIAFGSRFTPFKRALAGQLEAGGDSRAQTRPLSNAVLGLLRG